MELLVFSMTALLAAGAFVALRMVRLAAGRWWRWAGTAACAACGAALVAVAVLVLRRVDQVMSSRAASVEPEPLAATLASVAAVQDLWLFDTALFVVLGVVQGAALGLALSVITGPDAPVTDDAPARLEAWRSVLGKAVVALPLPAIAAVAFTFYQENRERFSSVEVGSFLRLALNPAPISGSQQSTPQGPSGDGRLFPTWTFVDRAWESLNGALRRRDLAFVAALKGINTEARVPTERDFEQTAHLEMQHCDWLRNLRSYVGHFDDYNLLTLDIGEPLLSLQIAWENETRELKRWAEEIGKHGLAVPVAPISKYDSAAQFTASEAGFRRLDTKAKSALARIGEQEGGGTASDVPCRQPAEQGTGPRPSPEARAQAPASGGGTSIPPASRSDANGNGDASGWTADKTRSRILDLHAPYRAIGIANFYAAIGSFETAYLVLQRWLAIDGLLRADDLGLRDALPRWFRLRVMSEAARMYKNTSQEARLSERYRRHLDEISGEYRTLLPDLPTKRKTGNTGCFAAPAGPAPARAAVDAIAALTLGRVTSQIEFYEVSGLSGAVSQRHVEDAKTLARLDFRCFEDAFEPSAAPERVSAALALYQANAVVAWGRLAIRWVEAGRALRRVSDDERRTTLGEVRIAVGGAVERLEHQARVEESRRGSQGGSKAWGGVEGESTLDYARVARRVLQEALALDQ